MFLHTLLFQAVVEKKMKKKKQNTNCMELWSKLTRHRNGAIFFGQDSEKDCFHRNTLFRIVLSILCSSIHTQLWVKLLGRFSNPKGDLQDQLDGMDGKPSLCLLGAYSKGTFSNVATCMIKDLFSHDASLINLFLAAWVMHEYVNTVTRQIY